MSSGSYFPPPVKVVEIPKKTQGVRRLGIPCVLDRIAQTVVANRLVVVLEPQFHKDSYGYRPGKSALDAVATVRKRCWQYPWILEFDIRGAFDNIDHELLMKAVNRHTSCKWMLLYIERWLGAPFEYRDGRKEARNAGTPQGGVVSPVLMNLFLHYVFDVWMTKHFPNNPFARYADDGVVHCRTESEAQQLKEVLSRRFAECKLELHSGKTKIVHCKSSNAREDHPNVKFTFLGYDFRPRAARRKRDGKQFASFLPAASQESLKHIKTQVRKKLGNRTNLGVQEVADMLNPTIRGWFNYFKRFYRSGLYGIVDWIECRLIKWLRRKFKMGNTKARKWLKGLRKREPQFFAHWVMLSGKND
jgi:RNA-directed DNA polymerase